MPAIADEDRAFLKEPYNTSKSGNEFLAGETIPKSFDKVNLAWYLMRSITKLLTEGGITFMNDEPRGFAVKIPFALNIPNNDSGCGIDFPTRPREWLDLVKKERENAGAFWMKLELPGDGTDIVDWDIGSVGGTKGNTALSLSLHSSELVRLRNVINAILLGCETPC